MNALSVVSVGASLDALARDRFGIAALRPAQRELLDAVLAGHDALGVLPTGSGKSLTYQLPALMLGPRVVVVVSPLLALIRDQRAHLARAGIASVELDSTLTSEGARAESEAAIREGRASIVYVTPERLAHPECVALLRARGVGLLAVDEAHTVAMWGHDFRPAYLGIARAREALGAPPLLALTATATLETRAEIVRALGMVEPCVVRGSVVRSNLRLSVVRTVNEMAKRVALMELLEEWRVARGGGRARVGAADGEGSGIVYAATVKAAEELYAFIAAMGVPVARYHGDMSARARADSQTRFMDGHVNVMVATKAFGMGVDKPDVRLVVHHAMPDSLESYVQEAGRAGRDGAAARCVLLYRLEDRRTQLFFMSRKYPSRADIEKVCAGNAVAAVRPRTREAIEAHVNAIPSRERAAFDVAAVAERLVRDTDTRRDRDRARLAAMMRYGESTRCRVAHLAGYFGESAGAPCGCCDACVASRETILVIGCATHARGGR